MKKLLVVLVVLAITAFGTMAFAADVTVSGSIDLRGRAFANMDHNVVLQDNVRDTSERVRLNIDAKAGDAAARISIENDYDTWGRIETPQGNGQTVPTWPNYNHITLVLREAWIDTPIAGPLHLKGGHQFLALGNAWFLRNAKYGDDAWLLYAGLDKLTVALADAKIAEGANDSDADFYAGLAVLKLGDMGTAGVDFSHVVFAKKHNFVAVPAGPAYGGDNTLENLGVNANLNLGILKLQAQVDMQMGKNKAGTDPVTGFTAESKYKGNEIVAQATIPMDPITISATVARGSGNDLVLTGVNTYAAGLDKKVFMNVLDFDMRSTFLYEYKFGQPGVGGVGAHAGFANTTAISAGADVKLGSLTVGASAWMLKATQKVAIFNTTAFATLTDDLGLEIDGRVNWKISDNVSLNTNLGYFMPGDAYKRLDALTGLPTDGDEGTGIQSVLTMKF